MAAEIAPDDQECWIPENVVEISTTPVENENGTVAEIGQVATKKYELGDELNRGVNAEWWRMARCRAKAKAKWGTGRVNARAVEAETLRLYRQTNW